MKSVMLTMALILCTEFFCVAQKATPSAPPQAPVPVQIVNAKTVFISNAQGEEPDPRVTFLKSFDPSRPYNEFFAAIEGGGRFKPVLAPADADLILDFRFRTYVGAPAPGGLRLVILDPKTHAVLWALSETVKQQGGPHYQEKTMKNFDNGMSALVADLMRLATPSGTTMDDTRK
ncbi:MAG TPA: hypothetical protein VMX38_10585 [Verrucomicrobiae bacterium]|jgi:hypothetical protein|nr:hypothetical protein [Verrucomicrobiae bacterium]